ncbi:MAG: CAP domain-containing protein [Leptolyngbyaceae cyanobacterium]
MSYLKQMQRRFAPGVALSLTVGMWASVVPPSFSEIPSPQVVAQADSFSDIGGHLYQAEILRAASLGFIAGPGDGTFRPNSTVTREQAVSIILSAVGVTDAQLVGVANPFQDVPSNRWSAGKIAYAANNNIVAGRGPGVFDPTATVTRAELMAMLKNVADTTFAGRTSGTTTAFSDTADHWANDTITYLSGYCGVATPLNERGTGFAPNVGATRAFTAAAIVRLYDCGGTPATANTTPSQTTAQPVSSYESFSLTPGFVPDPATGSGISGGGDSVPNSCGFGGDVNLSGAPDHILTVEQPFSYLRINVTSDADVSFVMQNGQNGVFTCVDDSDGTLLPQFEGALAAGTYYIWVGDFAPNTGFPYEIAFTEFAPTAPASTDAFTQELLAAHNQYRTAVGATALTWSPALATTAQQWADQLAANGGSLAHSDRSQRNGAGENLAAGGPPDAYSLTDLVDLWGAEQQYFISGLPFPAVSTTGNWADVGHYTQIIWRNTTEVGCGVAIGGGQEILVCHYNPPGNVTGQQP